MLNKFKHYYLVFAGVSLTIGLGMLHLTRNNFITL